MGEKCASSGELRDRIEAYMEANTLSKAGFARLINVPYSTFNGLMTGKSNSGSHACLPALRFLEVADRSYVTEAQKKKRAQKRAAAKKAAVAATAATAEKADISAVNNTNNKDSPNKNKQAEVESDNTSNVTAITTTAASDGVVTKKDVLLHSRDDTAGTDSGTDAPIAKSAKLSCEE